MLLPQNCIKYDRTSIKALNQCGFFHNHCKIKLTIIQGMVIFNTIFLCISLSKRIKPWAHYKLVFYKHESNT